MKMETSSHLDGINIHDASLTAPEVQLNPGEKYHSRNRHWQGIPGIERTAKGRFFAAWYSGGKPGVYASHGEGPDNYVLLVQSEDDTKSWSEPVLVIDPPGKVRAFDPVLWIDPKGRLWLFWSQSYMQWNGRGGVWFIRCDEPDVTQLRWTPPRRIANGVMMNKPLVRSNGEWLFPVAVWECLEPRLPELAEERRSNVLVSADEGESFVLRGGADIPYRNHDEHMLIERRDGSLWMLVRTNYGIGQSISHDGGATWTRGWPTDIENANSRFYIGRLPGGQLLMVSHYRFTEYRSHLTASLSEDDGKTWHGYLLLDERKGVSYPDVTLGNDGRIYVIYDRERYGAREILLASFTEEEVVKGKIDNEGSFLRRIVDKIPGD
jgi:predicted neuraminidase